MDYLNIGAVIYPVRSVVVNSTPIQLPYPAITCVVSDTGNSVVVKFAIHAIEITTGTPIVLRIDFDTVLTVIKSAMRRINYRLLRKG